MHLNYGLFEQNGKCGYVLKPSFLRHDQVDTTTLKQTTKTLVVRVISGQQLPKPDGARKGDVFRSREIIDPYVTVSIHGVKIQQKLILQQML